MALWLGELHSRNAYCALRHGRRARLGTAATDRCHVEH